MMRKRTLAAALSLAFAWMPFTASAQSTDKMHRLGWLQGAPSTAPFYEGLRQGLRELGYVDGKNIEIVVRSANGQVDRLPDLARELARLDPEVILASADQGLKAAKEATNSIPIVIVTCDPLDSVVASIARPGGNATGLTCMSSDLAGKRLQLLKELAPTISRVAVLYNPEDRNKASEYAQMQSAAQTQGMTLRAFEARSAGEIDAAFDGMVAGQMQALVILTDAVMVFYEKKLAELALKNRLPAIYSFRGFADAGGLASYGANLRDTYRHAASYVDKIFHGTDPRNLPVDQASKFELVLNLKTARALGLTVPPSVLARAEETIE